MNLGNIQPVSPREVWLDEALYFTPWLAENIDKLGNALGLNLQVQQREAPVGSFSLDILAWDVVGERPVIIENQLDTTDHDHLGKLLTYAAGYDACVVVWLAREFRDEHRQGLDWLNQRTGDNTEFFGVVVEAWQIDYSRPVPQSDLVVAPSFTDLILIQFNLAVKPSVTGAIKRGVAAVNAAITPKSRLSSSRHPGRCGMG